MSAPRTPRFARSATFLALVTATPTATRTLTPSPTISATPVLERVAMAPLTAKRQVGQFQNFSVTAHFSDGSTKNFTQKVIYSSTDLNVAFPPNAMGNAGKVDAVGVGVATIYVTEPTTGVNSNTTNESAVFEVVEAPTPTPTRTGATPTATRSPTPTATATPRLLTLTIAPLTPKRSVGQFQNFSVTGTFSDGSTKNMTQLVTYASSNTAVATTPNEDGNRGKVLAVGPGFASISAAHASGVATTESAVFEVVVPPTPTPTRTGATPTKTFTPSPTVTPTPVVVSIVVAPATAKRTVGSFQNFTCTATLSDGNTKNFTQRCTYASSDTAVAVAPNDPLVNKGRVNAVGVGVATISAIDEASGVATGPGETALFEVVPAPTPTPTLTGTTPTRTKTPSPTPTATPILLSLTLAPPTAKRAAGTFQNFSVSGTYSNGDVKNLTQKVDYVSSNPAVAFPPNDTAPGANKGRVNAVAAGVATISAKDPDTGITTTASGGNATFTVTEAPTPTPTRTGPTSTAPTGTRTFTPSPVPTATPVLVALELAPTSAQKVVGAFQNFTATGTFSDGQKRNVTQLVTYVSSDPSIAEAPNLAGNRGRVSALRVGVATISARDDDSGVATTDETDATLTVVEGNGTPNPRATATPAPVQVGNPTTVCQRELRRAARGFVAKKLKALERCGNAASRCIQKKPDDPACLDPVRRRCAQALIKVGEDEAKLIASVLRRCAALTTEDVLGADGLAYGDLAASCAARFGRTLTDLTSVAQCLAAQHACRAEVLFARERPRVGELLRILGASPDACREDFGGSGLGLGDPRGVAKRLERCVATLVKSGSAFAAARLVTVGRCLDEVFLCVEAAPNDPACLGRATRKCDKEFTKLQRTVAKVTVATTKACQAVDFSVLRNAAGGNLDAVIPGCADYDIPSVTSLDDWVACVLRQHECETADLLRYQSPRAAALLDRVGRGLSDGACPEP